MKKTTKQLHLQAIKDGRLPELLAKLEPHERWLFMRFDFGRATDITLFAKIEYSHMYSDETKRIYLCPDTWDYHILRVVEGYDEEYEACEGSFILEHNKIRKQHKTEYPDLTASQANPYTIRALRSIMDEDDGGNWDYSVKPSLEECVRQVDGGHGIISFGTNYDQKIV